MFELEAIADDVRRRLTLTFRNGNLDALEVLDPLTHTGSDENACAWSGPFR